MKKIILTVVVSISLLAVAAYYYAMHGGARDVSSEDAVYTITSPKIINEFTKNIESSNKKYLEKPIIISGKITAINNNQIIIDNAVICILKNKVSSIQNNQTISVKGRVVGYDDLMGELKLDQCIISNNQTK